jgi:uncharacterized protein YndB with AHSA1/START domain
MSDRIEKQILLHATRDRVWRALTDSTEFGHWFGVELDSPFTPGAQIRGAIVGTKVDPQVAELQKAHHKKPFEITIDRIEPQTLFSFRWHPHAVEPGHDYSAEPTTLVTFTLEDASGGILLTVTESGFDRIPLERRATAFTSNDGGWAIMVGVLEKHLSHAARA